MIPTNKNRPSFDFENQCKGLTAGVDEAGCGPWAGPVVAAAVIIDQSLFPETFLNGINDSKKLSKKKREDLYAELIHHPCLMYHIGTSTVEEIDQLNIWGATQLAMLRALEGLALKPTQILIDGKRKPTFDYPVQFIRPLAEPTSARQVLGASGAQKRSVHEVHERETVWGTVSRATEVTTQLLAEERLCMRSIVKGDQKSFSIATASIIAKVKRDEIMHKLHQEHPHFGWHKNAGYGTAEHQQALKQYGVTLHHRKSFAPIRSLIAQAV